MATQGAGAAEHVVMNYTFGLIIKPGANGLMCKFLVQVFTQEIWYL